MPPCFSTAELKSSLVALVMSGYASRSFALTGRLDVVYTLKLLWNDLLCAYWCDDDVKASMQMLLIYRQAVIEW